MPVTIFLVDQHPIVREGLKTVLGEYEDFRVIGETGDGLEAVQLADRLRPDLLLVEVIIPGISGLEVIRQVCQRLPRTRVLVLSRYANEAYVLEALRNGATGYVLKRTNVNELVQAVRHVVAGRLYLCPFLAERISGIQAQRARTRVLDLYETLTTREREVLRLVAEGRTNNEIAGALGIGHRTVETYRLHLRQKLGLRTQADLIRYALGRGLLPPEQ
jgi:two-component system response regulator NreC